MPVSDSWPCFPQNALHHLHRTNPLFHFYHRSCEVRVCGISSCSHIFEKEFTSKTAKYLCFHQTLVVLFLVLPRFSVIFWIVARLGWLFSVFGFWQNEAGKCDIPWGGVSMNTELLSPETRWERVHVGVLMRHLRLLSSKQIPPMSPQRPSPPSMRRQAARGLCSHTLEPLHMPGARGDCAAYLRRGGKASAVRAKCLEDLFHYPSFLPSYRMWLEGIGSMLSDQ